MRTHKQLLDEIEIRKALGLPRIELTEEERQRAFGDPALERKYEARREIDLVRRLQQGLPMSRQDKRDARRWMREGV